MFIQMGLTWVMIYEHLVMAVEPSLCPVRFTAGGTFVRVPPVASCKLKHSLYHLIHSSIKRMLMLCPLTTCKLKHSLYHLIHSSITRMLMLCPLTTCKLKQSLYHLIHSCTTCMQMLYPIRSSGSCTVK